MRSTSRLRGFAAIVLCCLVAACQDKVPPPAADTPAQVPAAKPMPEASLPDSQWVLHGLDQGERRYSELSQINRDTLGELLSLIHI